MAHKIRSATALDIERLAQLRYDFRSRLSTAVEDEATFVTRCRDWMDARIHDARWHCWLVEDEDRLIGNVWIQLIEKIPTPTDEAEEHAYLTNFFVLDTERGRGIGSELLSHVLRWVAQRDVQSVFLWPTMRTRALYERHGFRADGDVMQILLAPRAQ